MIFNAFFLSTGELMVEAVIHKQTLSYIAYKKCSTDQFVKTKYVTAAYYYNRYDILVIHTNNYVSTSTTTTITTTIIITWTEDNVAPGSATEKPLPSTRRGRQDLSQTCGLLVYDGILSLSLCTRWITLRYCPVTAVMSRMRIVLLSRDIFGDVFHVHARLLRRSTWRIRVPNTARHVVHVARDSAELIEKCTSVICVFFCPSSCSTVRENR